MGQIKKLYQDTSNNYNIEAPTSGTTESNAVYPITSDQAVYHSAAWGNLGSNSQVDDILSALNNGYLFMGVATPSTNPATPSGKVFYIAGQDGTYSHFGITASGLTIIRSNGTSWVATSVGITSGGGGSTPSSIEGYIGTTQVQSTAGAQNLQGINNLYLSDNAKIYWGGTGDVYLEYTSNGFHFSQAVYSDEEMAAGGIGSGGGSGTGGITIDRVWQSLTVNTEHVDEKINIAHIPDITVDKITDIEDWITEKAYLTTEEEPAFTESAASTITSEMIAAWNSILEIRLNGNVVTPDANGVVDLGTVLTSTALDGYVSKTANNQISGTNTFTAQMLVKSVVPSSDNSSGYTLGSSSNRFQTAHAVSLYTSSILIKRDINWNTTYGQIAGNTNSLIIVAGSGDTYQYIFSNAGFYPVSTFSLGQSSHRWGTIYGNDLNISDTITVGSNSIIREANNGILLSKNAAFNYDNGNNTVTRTTFQSLVDRITALEGYHTTP